MTTIRSSPSLIFVFDSETRVTTAEFLDFALSLSGNLSTLLLTTKSPKCPNSSHFPAIAFISLTAKRRSPHGLRVLCCLKKLPAPAAGRRRSRPAMPRHDGRTAAWQTGRFPVMPPDRAAPFHHSNHPAAQTAAWQSPHSLQRSDSPGRCARFPPGR